MTEVSATPVEIEEKTPVRRDPIVIALAILANLTAIICLTYGKDPLIIGPYGVFRLTASYGLLRMKTYGLILERVSALFWVAIAVLIMAGLRGGAFDQPRFPFGILIVLSGIFSLGEFWYLGRAEVKARFAKRGQPGAPLPLVAKVGWFGGQLALLLYLQVARPLLPTIMSLVSDQNRTNWKRTMADMRTIASALEARAMDANEYPFAASVEAIAPKISPTYLKQVPLRDGWGNQWRYGAWKSDPKNPGCDYYVIISAGRDGRFEFVDPKSYTTKATTNFDCDLVFSNGAFVQYPEGMPPPGPPY